MTGTTNRRLWLSFGWLAIGYVVLTFASAVFQAPVVLGDPASKVSSALVTSSMGQTFTGGYIEFLATLIFLATGLLLAQLLRGADEVSRWLSSCVAGATLVYVAVTVACGLAAGAAAVYDGHHGAPLATVTAVNDIRNIGFALTGGVAGAMVLAASAAGAVTRLLPRWLVYGGYLVSAVCIAAVPAVKAGAPQMLLWFGWLLVTGVVALRRAAVRDEAVVMVPAIS